MNEEERPDEIVILTPDEVDSIQRGVQIMVESDAGRLVEINVENRKMGKKKTVCAYDITAMKFDQLDEAVTKDKLEGIVLLGAGGKLSTWIEGVTNALAEIDVIAEAKPTNYFQSFIKLHTTRGRTDLVMVMKPGKDNFDVGKMAMWRLRFGDCSWLSDYIDNYANQHRRE